MKCIKCGLVLDQGVQFCGNCGQPVAVAAAPVAAPTAVPAPGVPAAVPAPAVPAAAPGTPPAAPAAAPGTPPATPIPTPPAAGPAYPVGVPIQPGGGKAIASMILGIIGLIAWIVPLIGFPMGVAGLILGIKSVKSAHKGMAITGIVLSSIIVALSVLLVIARMQHFSEG